MVIPFFMKKPACAALSVRKCFTSSLPSRHKEKLTSYCQVANYTLNTHANDDIITKAEADVTNYKQLQELNAVDYSGSLWTKALSWGPVFDEYQLKGTFAGDLCSSMLQGMRSYWAKNKGASFQELPRHAV